MMRVWILIVFIIASVSAFPRAEPNGCEQCRSGVKLLWENVRSADNIYWENYLLDVGVCDENAKDPEACKTWFNTWWERLAQMIYGEETVPYVCKEVSHGQCEAPSVFDNRQGCETCVDDVTRVVNAYHHQDFIDFWETHLEGQAFCKNPELGFTEEQILECDGNVKQFIGPAFFVLRKVLTNGAPQICTDIFECPDDHPNLPPDFIYSWQLKSPSDREKEILFSFL